jgi:hypothetical protein|tara:strand:- start:5403 stop:5753 length:351 start_codon:yes stop_codon:yes gene_type:complete
MKRMEIRINGLAVSPRAVAQAAVDAAAGAGMEGGRASISYGNVQGEAVLPQVAPVACEEESPAVEEQASVLAVGFASSKAARLADELNVPASAFDGAVPSGKRGFTLSDVMALARG